MTISRREAARERWKWRLRGRDACRMAFVVWALSEFPQRGQAQSASPHTISGTVREASLRASLASVSVQLIDSGGQRLSATITDSNGHFRLRPPAPGAYRVRAARPGYLLAESPLVRVGDAAVVVDLELTRGARLDSVLVVGARDALALRPTQQLIRGRLVDDDSGEPIENGTIELREAKNRTVATATTDPNGFFRLVTPSPGTYSLRGRRIGYQASQQDSVRMRIGDTVRIEFRLSRNAAILAPVLVTESARPWNDRRDAPPMHELYDRMKRFAGRRHAQFILRGTLDAFDRKSYSTGQMLARLVVPGLPRGPGCSGQTHYLDGLASPTPLWGLATPELYEPNGLEAIEVYTHPAIPAEFAAPLVVPGRRSPMVPPCRVLSFWIRPRERRP